MSEDNQELRKAEQELRQSLKELRDSGAIDSDDLAKLDSAFEELSPAGIANTFDDLLRRAEEEAFISTQPQTDSNKPAGALVKKTIVKTISWYIKHLADQMTTFSSTTVRLLSRLDERVSRLESLHGGTSIGIPHSHLYRGFSDHLVSQLGNVAGPVVHCYGGGGELVKALGDAGVDAVAVSDKGEAHDAQVEVKIGDALEVLESFEDKTLAGVVLSEFTDTSAAAYRDDVLAVVSSKLFSGGLVFVIGAYPEGFSQLNPVASDLAPGQPFSSDTWEYLLNKNQFRGAVVEASNPDAYLVKGFQT